MYHKIAILLAVLLVAGAAHSSDVSFRWDPNVEPDIAGYRLYRSATSGGPYTQALEIPCGPNDPVCATGTLVGEVDGTWYYVATAYDTQGFESDWSNEQCAQITGDTYVNCTAGVPPGQVQNLIIEVVTP